MRNPSGYYRPGTLQEAVRLLTQQHIKTVPLSGGALQLAKDDPDYEAVVDLQAVPGLSDIQMRGDGFLQIGGAASLEAVLRSPDVPEPLRQMLKRSIPWNRRNAISVAEALAHPSRMAEVVAGLAAFGAEAVFAVPEEYRVPVEAVGLLQPGANLIQRGLLAAVVLPRRSKKNVWGMAHVARTPADSAIVSVAVVLATDEAGTVEDARLVLTGVSVEPVLVISEAVNVLRGRQLDGASAADVVAAVEQAVQPVADSRGSMAYRRAMAGVLTKRALTACIEQLQA